MILTDCTACADEQAAGAAFCEVCGRELSAGPEPAASQRSAQDWMDCPHCKAERTVGADGYCEECGMLAGRPRDHLEADGGAVAAAVSDRGRRHHRNEDAMWLAVGVAAADVVVCDGVSASFDPDAASDIAARTAGEYLAAAQHPPADTAAGEDDPNADITTDLSAVPAELAAADAAEAPNKSEVSDKSGEPGSQQLPADAEAPGDAEADRDAEAPSPATAAEPGVDKPLPLAGAEPDAAAQPDAGRPSAVPEKPAPAVAIAGVVAAAIAGAAEAVASLAHTGDPRRAASNPACTIVAAAVRGPHVGFGWVGDSRAYWVRAEGPAQQLTEDDSWARHVIALGVDPQVAMSDPKAHAITAWLGADAGPVRPRVGAFTATEPGFLVLCSDGLWNYLTDPGAFADVVRDCLVAATGPSRLLAAARALVAYANEAGGADNITVALIPVHPAVAETPAA